MRPSVERAARVLLRAGHQRLVDLVRLEDCFFFNDPATTEISALSLHDALPISRIAPVIILAPPACAARPPSIARNSRDRKSTRLNSSHLGISYAVFCLKKN